MDGVAMFSRKVMVHSACLLGLVALLSGPLWPQQPMSKFEHDRAQDILEQVANEVQKHYYDTKFHGLDWAATVADAKQKIAQDTSMNMAMSRIAAALDKLNDSHTFFIPPQHAFHHDYGWQYQMVGDRCFVTRVRPGSDAEVKGVKPGDEILSVNGFAPTRDNLWKMHYVFSVLRPQAVLRLALQDPVGQQRTVDIAAKIRDIKRVTDLTIRGGGSDIWDVIRDEERQAHMMRARSAEYGDQLLILKIPEFLFTQTEVENLIDRARKHTALIVDLRGDPGGAVDTLKNLVSGVFEKEVKIDDRLGRKDEKPEIAKASRSPFTGKLVVLVDSGSASAAEMFARIVQLEKRGTVIGDRTSGSVMEARRYNEKIGLDTVVFFGVSVTESDLIMTDGQSLEHKGVIPDEIALPSPKDLAAGRDPVIAHAAELLGVKLTPETAGKLFPYEWQPE
jgi:C-terminal processing protease CtpA/Prc